ncbi:hypothetical protein GH714_041330 [Hevea brasiliensis]|uniref:J domain-containing protein n=1 Tax=Hevea brasiliensis TaxID=3981 RepID=A0A6A6N0N9_HEVBR|nr:hypothetical protein GH714_041330 [Hevea brasiliensis]
MATGRGEGRVAASSSILSPIKAYAVPLFLFALAIFYQLVVLPRSFPPSHYDVLGIERHSSIEEVKDAYEKLSSKWNSGIEVPSAVDFIEIQYAYELLTNSLWKRDYNIFGIDEQLHVLDKFKEQYAGESFSHIGLPLLEATSSVHSASLLEGVANAGMVELGDVQLAASLAERMPTGHFFFRNGLPSLVAFPPGFKISDCLIKYDGDLSIDAVTDWFATVVLGFPRILCHS